MVKAQEAFGKRRPRAAAALFGRFQSIRNGRRFVPDTSCLPTLNKTRYVSDALLYRHRCD